MTANAGTDLQCCDALPGLERSCFSGAGSATVRRKTCRNGRRRVYSHYASTLWVQVVSPGGLAPRRPLPQMTADDELPIIDPSDIPDDTTAFLCKDPAQLKSFQEEIDHTNGTAEAAELLCVLAVIRHGDRTPKQKLKLTVRPPDSPGAAVHVAVLPAYTVSFRCLHSRQHSGAQQLSLLTFMNVLKGLT